MKREEYNSCIAKNMTGKRLSKEERKLEFCIVAKLCAGKVKNREEAKLVCSLPKEPKPAKASRAKKPQTCEKEALQLAHCVADRIDMGLASNINSIETALVNAIIECRCQE